MLSRLFIVALVLTNGFAIAQPVKVVKKDTVDFKFTVEPAPEWTNLFYRTSGWFGGDGIFSIPVSGVDKNNNAGNDSTMLVFGDTFFGEVENDKPATGKNAMVNNSVAYLKGNDPNPLKLHFYNKKLKNDSLVSLFIPQTSSFAKPQLFWMGDGFVNREKNNTTYLFAYKVERTGEGVFDFIEPGVSIIAIPKGAVPPFEKQRQIETPFHVNDPKIGEGNFGAGILVNTKWAGAPAPDGYVYVYGCIGQDKNLVVARVQPKDFEDTGKWKFWNGKSWSDKMSELTAVTNAASNELSVTPLPDGRFLLVFQVLGLSDKVGIRVGASPVGPFSAITEIYTTPEFKEGIWTYNAKAHPSLSKPGELLISYNTITPDFWNDIKKNAHIYRPRFIKLKFKIP